MKIYGLRREDITLENVFRGLMAYPYFPVQWDTLKADITFKEIDPHEIVELSKDCKVVSFPTVHPGGNLAYAIHGGGKKVVYLTDLDHGKMDLNELMDFIKYADLLIYDANFTQEEYEMDQYEGWGHSTWEFGLELAKEAYVKHLVIFHHGVQRKIEEMRELETVLYRETIHVSVAREGMTLRL
jgi:phosphoribosyl 1,2-cyclic phosphodiesterase